MDDGVNVQVRTRHLVEALESAVRSGVHGLTVVPDLLRRCLQEDSWRDFTTAREERVHHETFEEFLTAPPLKGLGVHPPLLRKLLTGDSDLIAMFDAALEGRFEPISEPKGMSGPDARREQVLQKLGSVAPELHEQVLAGALSTNAAMVRAGLRHSTASVPIDDVTLTAKALRRRLEPEQVSELIRALQDD